MAIYFIKECRMPWTALMSNTDVDVTAGWKYTVKSSSYYQELGRMVVSVEGELLRPQ